jgi:hypothetical protein
MQELARQDSRYERAEVGEGGSRRILPREGGRLQARAPRRARRWGDHVLPPGCLHRPLPRPAPPEHQTHQGRQAPLPRRGLLARRREAEAAHADLRGLLPQAEAPRGTPRTAGARPPAGPPEARPRARPVHVRPEGGAGPPDVAPEGGHPPRHPRKLSQRGAGAPGVRARRHPAHRAARALPHERALSLLQGLPVPPDDRGGGRRGRGGLPPQADELPAPHTDLRAPPPLLPRPPRPLRGVRDGLPLRAVRRARGADARSGVHAGRRPHLLHARAGQRGIQGGH